MYVGGSICFLLFFQDLVQKTEVLIQNLEQKHAEVRAIVQEKLNQIPNDPIGASDHVEDNDDIRSTASEGVSESSSRKSSSRLAMEHLVQKATNAVITKVIRAGT